MDLAFRLEERHSCSSGSIKVGHFCLAGTTLQIRVRNSRPSFFLTAPKSLSSNVKRPCFKLATVVLVSFAVALRGPFLVLEVWTMKTIEVRSVKDTKVLRNLLDRYGIKLRKGDTVVTHATYRRETQCDPLAFAVFELAMQALVNHYSACLAGDIDPRLIDHTRKAIYWTLHICEQNDIEFNERPDLSAKQTYADYGWACRTLIKASLYHDLLD